MESSGQRQSWWAKKWRMDQHGPQENHCACPSIQSGGGSGKGTWQGGGGGKKTIESSTQSVAGEVAEAKDDKAGVERCWPGYYWYLELYVVCAPGYMYTCTFFCDNSIIKFLKFTTCVRYMESNILRFAHLNILSLFLGG
jgi:hypothetical protein